MKFPDEITKNKILKVCTFEYPHKTKTFIIQYTYVQYSIQYISSVYSPIYKFPPNFVSLITRDRLILVYFSLEENTGHVFCLKYGLTSLHTPGLALQLRFLSELYVVHTLYIYTWVYLTRGIFPLSPSFGGAGGGGMYS